MKHTRWYWLLVSLAVMVVDQVTKQWAIQALSVAPMRVFAWLNFHLAFNTGAAFSLFAESGPWSMIVLLVLPVLVCLAILVWMWRTPATWRWQQLALSLILGGAIGNLWDRARLGYVIDFIDCHWAGWHYATFNVADSAVCVGAGLLVMSLWRYKEEE